MNASTSGFKREYLDTHATVFQTGDSGDAAYVIESGCVEILSGPPDTPVRLAVLAEGAMFGEVALLDHQPRTATVKTLMPTSLIRIDRVHVEELLVRADPVIQYLLRLLLERFRSSSGKTPSASGTPANLNVAGEHYSTPDLHAAAVRTLSLAHDLSAAIGSSQLELFYQPIISLSSNTVNGFEGLVRWRHPTMGLVNPDEFIPLAEKTGLIHRIGDWVLRRGMLDWPRLRELCNPAPGQTPFVSLNLSGPELCQDGIVESVQQRLGAMDMPPHELRIELTETTVITSLDQVTDITQRLRALGVGIALDDFGTGYAGLDYLQTLPFSSLKIDKSFVQQMHTSERSFQIVKAALELSKRLGLSSVAEGIEDRETATALLRMGCDYAQGYLFAKPMPLEMACQWTPRF
ncbi:EAL domain-containing protein [Rhodoferax sp. GW822-FHT02A01]|uniref:EAL domain-containing protein n=1 Tax=Rhodoferax sp. GW822-FHT02A01 TaxID=3141537 RepID=UPI00315D25AB